MSGNMRAVRFYEKGDIRVDQVPTPQPGPGQIRIRPSFVGICGTDVHEYNRGATLIPTEPHPSTLRSPPLTLGHEISGVVDAIGPGVSDISLNDHVAIQPIVPDNDCYACRKGRPNCCTKQGFYGLSADGGLADYLIVAQPNARKVPASLSLELAALVEPLSVGWHAVRVNLLPDYESALVVGAGPIGLAVILALKAHGITTVIVADTNPVRRETAMRAGADHFVLSPAEDVVAACRRILPGNPGVHVAFDTAGVQATLDGCVAATCVGGTIVNIAIWGGPATILPNLFAFGEKKFVGSAVYTDRDFDAVIDAIASGTIDPGFMITSKIALEDLVEKGLKKLLHDPGSDIKILVDVAAGFRG